MQQTMAPKSEKELDVQGFLSTSFVVLEAEWQIPGLSIKNEVQLSLLAVDEMSFTVWTCQC